VSRIVIVPASLPLWQEFCTEGWSVGLDDWGIECIDGLPEGAELVNSYYDGSRQTVNLVFQHPSFRDVQFGEIAPMLTPAHLKKKAAVNVKQLRALAAEYLQAISNNEDQECFMTIRQFILWQFLAWLEQRADE